MPKFRKKPVVIEAVQYDATNRQEITDWCPAATSLAGHLVILTLEGNMRVAPGDYVIKGVKGEFYPCKPDIFEASYESVEDAPPGFDYLRVYLPIRVDRRLAHDELVGLQLNAADAAERALRERNLLED